VLEYGTHKQELLKYNPMGKFPTLLHGETVVTEAAAIISYLADAFPEKGLAPEIGSKEHGTYYRWLFYAAGPMEAAIIDKVLGLNIENDKKVFVGYGCFDDVIATLDKKLSEDEYVLGDKFSAADIYLGSSVHYGLQFNTLPDLPSFVRYAQQISSREAYVRSDEIDNKLLGA
jgi:glutathione S-transferase